MTGITVLTEAALRSSVGIDADALEAVAGAFAALGRGGVVMPPVLRLDLPDGRGEMDVKTAYVPDLDGFALKVSTGFFGNAALGLPSLGGMMTLLDARTGHVRAVLLDNGYLTDVRTALAGALAARHLARADATVAGIVGTGLQARLQLEALRLVRPIERVLVWGRDGGKAAALAAEIRARHGLAAEAVPDTTSLVRSSDIVVTTTASRTPLVSAEGLHPGLHVTAMGADAPEKQELDAAVLAGADLLVVDRRSQCERMGELHHAGAVPAPVVELGTVVAGLAPGRTSDTQLTVCDLTGTGAQDTAIALFAFERAKGLGTVVG